MKKAIAMVMACLMIVVLVGCSKAPQTLPAKTEPMSDTSKTPTKFLVFEDATSNINKTDLAVIDDGLKNGLEGAKVHYLNAEQSDVKAIMALIEGYAKSYYTIDYKNRDGKAIYPYLHPKYLETVIKDKFDEKDVAWFQQYEFSATYERVSYDKIAFNKDQIFARVTGHVIYKLDHINAKYQAEFPTEKVGESYGDPMVISLYKENGVWSIIYITKGAAAVPASTLQ